MVQLLVQQALDALERGETDVAGAILHAAVHGWAEGHIEGEDGCDGCGYRGDDPEAAGRLRRYRG